MQKRQLKRLIETGHYQPEPERIACAMLRRRGVRDFLTGAMAGSAGSAPIPAGANGSTPKANLPLNPADRIQSSSAVPRQAA